MHHRITVLTLVLMVSACGTPRRDTPRPDTFAQASSRPEDTDSAGKTRTNPVTSKADTRPTVQPVKLTIVQRHSEPIPGLTRTIRVHIGDITHQQTLTQVTGPKGAILIARRAMRVGDVGVFRAEGSMHTLGLARLVNFLIGDDYAEFFVGSPRAVAEAQIKAILEHIQTSKTEFLRNGEGVKGSKVAEDLRRRYLQSKDRVTTAREFFEIIASKAGLSSRPYQVRFGNRDITLIQWLGGSDTAAYRSR